jgi:hypothetical protein
MFYKVARYNIPVYAGRCEIEVPDGAEPVGILTDTVTTTGETPLFLCVNEPMEEGDVDKYKIALLVVGDGSPYGGQEEDETLLYLGYASWDSGYRIHHVFQVLTDMDFEDEYTITPADFDVDNFVETLENPEIKQAFEQAVEVENT